MAAPIEKVRHISEREWDGLKKMLYTHYILEDMTIPGIIKMMRETHNVSLT